MMTAQNQAAPPAPANSDPFSSISGTFASAKGLTARLQWAADNSHLISPATTCGRLPEGCSVALTVVYLDAEVDAHEVGFGKVGLLKHALMKLAGAAGVAFDPERSGRIDDGSDSYYCHWRAIGAWRHLDGSIIPLIGDKEMDLRDGSAQVERIFAKASTEEKGVSQLMETRSFIMAHAQSKAELRAIRKGLAIRSYTKAELRKPFVIAKLMFTGQSDNPRIAEANAAAIRNSMLGGSQALFGPPAGSTVPAQQLPVAHYETNVVRHAPPPVALTRADDDSSPRLAAAQARVPVPPPTPKPAAAPAQRRPRTTRAGGSASGAPFVAKFGRMKDTPITDWDDENLSWYTTAFKTSMEDASKANFRDSNEAGWKACLAERERREGAPPPEAGTSAQPPQAAPAPPDFDDEDDRGNDPDDY